MKTSILFLLFFILIIFGEIYMLSLSVWSFLFIPLFAIVDLAFIFILVLSMYADYKTIKEVK